MAAYHLLIAVVAISMLISILAFTVALDRFEIRPATDDAETELLSPDAIYLGGATIIGLATFGSALVIKIKIERTTRGQARQKIQIGVLLGGATGLIISQGILMLHACCGNVNGDTVFVFHFITLGFALAVIFSFGFLLEGMFSSSSRSPRQD